MMQSLSGSFAVRPSTLRSRSSNVACRRVVSVRAQKPNPILKDQSAVEQRDITFNPVKEGATDLQKVEKAKHTASTDDSLARVFYAPDAEQAVNEQINHEYTMSYNYHQMSSYFARDNVALPGLASFFRGHAEEERGHAQQLMDFQATRGGRSKLATLAAPETEYNHAEKGDALHAMEISLALEKLNFQYLFRLHKVADESGDAQFADFVESMLADQANGVKEVADFVTQLRRVGKGLGVYEWDKDIMDRGSAQLAQVSGTA